MKLFHLADLHLGRKLGAFSLVEDQKYILAQIVAEAESAQVYGLILAGDIYDRALPSEEAVGVFEEFLVNFLEISSKPQVFMVYGNHDGGKRLAFLHQLTGKLGIHISPLYDGTLTPVTVEKSGVLVDFYLLPFVSPLHLSRIFPEEKIATYQEGMVLMLSSLELKKDRKNVMITHQYIQHKGEMSLSDSEEHHYIGGTTGVSYELFRDFDYVALGHLHNPQKVGEKWIRYCGSLLKYSALEREKSITVVEIGENSVEIGEIPLKPLRDLLVFRGTVGEILEKATKDAYVMAELTDVSPVVDDLHLLKNAFPFLVSYHYCRGNGEMTLPVLENLSEKSPVEVFETLFSQQTAMASEKMKGKKVVEEGIALEFTQEQRDFLMPLVAEIWGLEE